MPLSETSTPCPECGGSGWVISPDGGAGRARPCDCRRRQRFSRLFAAAGVPERYAHCKLASFLTSSPDPREEEQLVRARQTCQLYVDQFLREDGSFRETGLLFLGPPGAGKTHLAVGVLLDLIRTYGVRGRFVDFNILIHQIQSTFDPGSAESKHEILDPLTECDVLILDELGAQHSTPWVRDILYLVINQRYMRKRPTLFTTNYRLESEAPAVRVPEGPRRPEPRERLDRGRDPEPAPASGAGPAGASGEAMRLLSSRIQASLVSRLYEMAQPIELTAVADFRRAFGQHKVRVAP
jgi:DNA replication protein DnaC